MRRAPGAVETVYQQIRKLIFDRQIPPGEKINIDRLARSLGVSQTPVREALQRLEGDKLVLAGRPRGYRTSDLLSAGELREMFEVRLLLEPWAARVAATERLGNPGGALLREIDRFARTQSAEDSGSVQSNSNHDAVFHQLILDAVGNRFLADAFSQLHAHLHLFRLFPADKDGSRTLAEHSAIAQAIADADPDGAEAAMRTHLRSALSRFAEGLNETEHAVAAAGS